ncbi:MAG TPA: KH domain-containing protein [Candidatus Merdicola faecigallinarum]|uniref:RNA-binding protein KhpA n=1 Tax=Candidatus Merdicola faecigallinarum TaxID=2840862 RepID=A0A9D1S955_9FIRM|nr:KH domain-containing protein [Candidatus Merdicola faecigallinarum]
MKETLEVIVKNLVDSPEEVSINELDGEKSIVFEVKVAETDMGKVIGKQGRVAKSVRTVMKAVAAKNKKRVTIEFIG